MVTKISIHVQVGAECNHEDQVSQVGDPCTRLTPMAASKVHELPSELPGTKFQDWFAVSFVNLSLCNLCCRSS